LSYYMRLTTALTSFGQGVRPTAAQKKGIYLNTDNRNNYVLVLKDLRAAFVKDDYNMLLHSLEKWVGLSATVLNWY